MKIEELVSIINKEMNRKESWLKLIAHSRPNNPVLYINEEEFKNLSEYKLLHQLAKYRILHEDASKNPIQFCTNSSTFKALANPSEFFYKFEENN